MPRNRLPRPNRDFRAFADQRRAKGNDFAETVQRGDQERGPKVDDYDASGRSFESGRGHYHRGRNPQGFLGRFDGMTAFRYQAIEVNGTPVTGVIEADDRKSALQNLGLRGRFPSSL